MFQILISVDTYNLRIRYKEELQSYDVKLQLTITYDFLQGCGHDVSSSMSFYFLFLIYSSTLIFNYTHLKFPHLLFHYDNINIQQNPLTRILQENGINFCLQ